MVRKVDESHLELDDVITARDETGDLYDAFSKMLSRVRELLKKTKETEEQKRISDLKALQTQINPHFLYNTLNSIKFLAVNNGDPNIAKISEGLSDMLHVNMNSDPYMTLEANKQYLSNYLNIQSYRYTFQFSYQIDLPDELKGCYIPKMLVQPLVENCMKHGYEGRTYDNELRISYSAEGGELYIQVYDNGVGMQQATIDEIMKAIPNHDDLHIGLTNVLSRIHLYFGEYYGMSINSQEKQYTDIRLHLPLITEANRSTCF